MTKVHEILGVDVDEEFRVYDKRFKILASGMVYRREVETNKWVWASTPDLVELINNPGLVLIIRKPKLTDEQRKVLNALYTLGFKWVAKEKDGSIFAYEEDPVKNSCGWYGSGYELYVERIALLDPLLPDWTKQLDIEKTLKEAQL